MGSVWEAAMFANHHNLDNLIAIIDRNNLTVLDFTEKIIKLNPFKKSGYRLVGMYWKQMVTI